MDSVESLAHQIKRVLNDAVPDTVARETLRGLIIDFARALIQQSTTDAKAAIYEAFHEVTRGHEV